MPSVKNPNTVSRNRQVARAAKAKKAARRASAGGRQSRVEKADVRRGAREGILPTSGPRAALSSKKQKKLDQQLKFALRRKEEAAAAAEAEMQGNNTVRESKKVLKKERDEAMEGLMQLDLS